GGRSKGSGRDHLRVSLSMLEYSPAALDGWEQRTYCRIIITSTTGCRIGEERDVTEFLRPLCRAYSCEILADGWRDDRVPLRSMMAVIEYRRRKFRLFAFSIVLVFLVGTNSALFQSSGIAEIATYQGADREQRLIEGAKREGEVMFYTSILVGDLAALATAFEGKYGIKVKSWRTDS